MQILLKQSVTSIKSLNQLLGLSEAEQQRLVSVGVGEGLMFVGNQHVGVRIISYFIKDDSTKINNTPAIARIACTSRVFITIVVSCIPLYSKR